MSLIRSNFDVEILAKDALVENERSTFRKRALEHISGSMVFVEDELIWWDITQDE